MPLPKTGLLHSFEAPRRNGCSGAVTLYRVNHDYIIFYRETAIKTVFAPWYALHGYTGNMAFDIPFTVEDDSYFYVLRFDNARLVKNGIFTDTGEKYTPF